MAEPGLLSMLIEGRRKDATGGILRVKVEPSPPAKVQMGVYIEINEEYRVSPDALPGTAWAVDHIAAQWDNILKYAGSAASNILKWNKRL